MVTQLPRLIGMSPEPPSKIKDPANSHIDIGSGSVPNKRGLTGRSSMGLGPITSQRIPETGAIELDYVHHTPAAAFVSY